MRCPELLTRSRPNTTWIIQQLLDGRYEVKVLRNTCMVNADLLLVLLRRRYISMCEKSTKTQLIKPCTKGKVKTREVFK